MCWKSNQLLIIEPGIRSIEPEAFAETNWTGVCIPASVERIGAAAFMNCTELEAVTLPEGLKEIGEGAFTGCISLKEIVLPKGLVSIGEMAFFGTGLRKITIPESVRTIGEMAFWDCGELRSAEVLGKNTKLEKDAFGACPSLAEGYFAPGFPVSGSPSEQLQMILVWCTAPERYDDDTNRLAETYFHGNEELIMEQILQDNRERAMKGILEGAPETVQILLSEHMDRYLLRCEEIGERQGMQALLLSHLTQREKNASDADFSDDVFPL